MIWPIQNSWRQRTQQLKYGYAARLPCKAAAPLQHGNEQPRHHHVLNERNVHSIRIVKFNGEQVYEQISRHKHKDRIRIKISAAYRLRPVFSAINKIADHNHYVERQPYMVYDQLSSIRRLENSREDKLPAYIEGQRPEGHPISLVFEGSVDDKHIYNGPAKSAENSKRKIQFRADLHNNSMTVIVLILQCPPLPSYCNFFASTVTLNALFG